MFGDMDMEMLKTTFCTSAAWTLWTNHSARCGAAVQNILGLKRDLFASVVNTASCRQAIQLHSALEEGTSCPKLPGHSFTQATDRQTTQLNIDRHGMEILRKQHSPATA